jgi:hypothetical protein
MKESWEDVKGIDDTGTKYGFGSPICSFCKNFKGFFGDRVPKCRAFDTIPDAIWFGENDHTKLFKNDNGIMFEPIDADMAK